MNKHDPPFDDAGKNAPTSEDDGIEQQLWERFKEAQSYTPGGYTRIAQIACDEFPMQKEQATNIIANWRNRGLVETAEADAHARLTEYGEEVEEI